MLSVVNFLEIWFSSQARVPDGQTDELTQSVMEMLPYINV